MRASGQIESLSYVTVYFTGCLVALFLSFTQHTPVQTLIVHAACSWGYVIYYVLNF
jgi:hypothetical protein